MILGAEIGMLIYGLYALYKGEYKLSKNRVATGNYARAAGFFSLLPMPLAFAAGYMIAISRVKLPETWGIAAVEVVIIILCLLISLSIAYAAPYEKAKIG